MTQKFSYRRQLSTTITTIAVLILLLTTFTPSAVSQTCPPTGTFSAADCPPDSSYLSADETQCICRPGYYVQYNNSDPLYLPWKYCAPCLAGTFSPTPDSTSCTPCGVGQQARRPAEASCEACPQNTYTNVTGTAVCAACPTKSTTLQLTGSTACICDSGFVEVYTVANASVSTVPTLTCQACPDGAECTSTVGVAKAKPGWWFDELETKQYYPCPDKFCCDIHNGAGCRTTDSYRCYPHRQGFLCGTCAAGYTSINGGDCVKCPKPNPIVLVVLVILALIFITFCLIENPSEDASTKLIVDYLQMVFLILNPTLGINDVLAIVHLEFGDATSQFSACVLPLPPILGLSASSLIPFGLFIILGIIHLLHWLISHYGPSAKRERWIIWYESNRWRYTNCAWEITLFGFMAIVSACVQILDCDHIGVHYVLSLAPSIECFSGSHFGVAIVALTLFCVLTFVVPIWLVSMLSELSRTTQRRSSVFLHSMRQIKALKKQYKKQRKAAKKQSKDKKKGGAGAGGAGGGDIDQKIMDIDQYLQMQMQQTRKVTRTGHEIALWCYRADKYWCEAAFLLRRVIFTLVTVLLSREKAAMIVIWFCLLILVFHARFPVFRKQSSSYFHDFALASVAFHSVLNLDIYATDPTGHVDFSSVTKRAQVVIVYGVTLLPVVIGLGLFFKEFLKERVRKKHAVVKENPNADLEQDLEEEEDDDDEDEGEEGAGGAPGTTAENSSSSVSRFLPRTPSQQAIELTQGVLAQGPNVSTRSYNNAPIDLDAVLASQNGGVISTPAYPNHHHPPVTIHF